MKKVVILLIVGVALCVAAFFVVRDFFEKAQLRSRISELGGLVSSGAGSPLNSLEREWWHRDMKASTDDFPEAELASNPMGRNDWLREWQQENTDLGGQNIHRIAAAEDVVFDERIAEGPYAGGWRLHWTWHQGVPDSGYGQRVKYEALWHYDEQYWRLVRLKRVGAPLETDHGPKPKK